MTSFRRWAFQAIGLSCGVEIPQCRTVIAADHGMSAILARTERDDGRHAPWPRIAWKRICAETLNGPTESKQTWHCRLTRSGATMMCFHHLEMAETD